MYADHMWWWGGMWTMFPSFFFLILLVLVPLVFWRRGCACRNNRREMPETPLEILKKRYARGEISREEFEQIRKDIS